MEEEWETLDGEGGVEDVERIGRRRIGGKGCVGEKDGLDKKEGWRKKIGWMRRMWGKGWVEEKD